jgi:hypothetical protein
MRPGSAESVDPAASRASIELNRFAGERSFAKAKRRSPEVRHGF